MKQLQVRDESPDDSSSTQWFANGAVRYRLRSVLAGDAVAAPFVAMRFNHTRNFWNLSGTFHSQSGAPQRGEQESIIISVFYLVQLGGLEPPTSCSTDRRSNQLSYSCRAAPRT